MLCHHSLPNAAEAGEVGNVRSRESVGLERVGVGGWGGRWGIGGEKPGELSRTRTHARKTEGGENGPEPV